MNDLKISTELASAVLGKEVTKCSLINKSRNSINITCFEDKEDFNPICKEWNIYEFAFKCKEWAVKNSIAFTLNYYNDSSVQFYCEKYHLDIESSSEIETIIKACEWILKEL